MLFALVAMLELMITTPGILLKFRLVYQICFVLSLGAVLIKKNITSLLLGPYYWPIGICLGVYTLLYLVGFAEQARVLTFVRGTAFFVFGFAVASNPKYFRYLLTVFCLFLLFIASQMQGGITSFGTEIEDRYSFASKASSNLGMGGDLSFKESVTSFLWHISFTSTLVASFLDQSAKHWASLLVAGIMIMVLLFCTVTLYTTAIVVVLVGICFLGVFYTWLTQMGDIVKLLFKVIMTLVVLYCAASITNHVLGDYGSREGMERYDRFGRLLSMVSGQESFNQVMDDVSSGRVSLFRRSLDVFAASPFFGVGDYNFERQGISGHSSALDLFALFGLFGGLPVVLLFIYCLRTAVRTGRLDVRYPWTMASCLAFLTTYSFTTPWNSIFLASAICEVLFFLVFGYVSGRHAILDGTRRMTGRATSAWKRRQNQKALNASAPADLRGR